MVVKWRALLEVKIPSNRYWNSSDLQWKLWKRQCFLMDFTCYNCAHRLFKTEQFTMSHRCYYASLRSWSISRKAPGGNSLALSSEMWSASVCTCRLAVGLCVFVIVCVRVSKSSATRTQWLYKTYIIDYLWAWSNSKTNLERKIEHVSSDRAPVGGDNFQVLSQVVIGHDHGARWASCRNLNVSRDFCQFWSSETIQ